LFARAVEKFKPTRVCTKSATHSGKQGSAECVYLVILIQSLRREVLSSIFYLCCEVCAASTKVSSLVQPLPASEISVKGYFISGASLLSFVARGHTIMILKGDSLSAC